MEKQQKPTYTVLALEGGGIHSLSYLPILENLENFLGCNIGRSKAIQMMIGTSSGTIVATAIKMGFSIPQIKELFLSESETIFTPTPIWNRLFHLYEANYIDEVLTRQLGNLTWEQLSEINPEMELVVTLLDAVKNRLLYLSTKRVTPDSEYLRKARVVDILVACCSIPYIFPARAFYLESGEMKILTDGALGGALNPSVLAISILKKESPHNGDIQLISMGGGDTRSHSSEQDILSRTILDNIYTVLDSMTLSDADSAHSFFTVYSDVLGVVKYLRTNQKRDKDSSLGDFHKAIELAMQFDSGGTFGDLISGSTHTRIENLSKDKLREIWEHEFFFQQFTNEQIQRGHPVDAREKPLVSLPIVSTWKNHLPLLVAVLLLTIVGLFAVYASIDKILEWL